MNTETAVVTVYTKPSCPQCRMTYLALDKKGIRYESVDVTTSPAALEYITEELGYSQAPVVVVDDETHWSGFRPDKIDQVAAALAAAGH
ncbi:glutaredoxin family protein [Arthrobacter sp. SO3]|uniref:glutaredoxin family protein n=1 Tax=Arthrobacter sp. SO3 TaxID=1897057 RepID=UPI001CFFC21D|nr:glutaredoxin family protein [Arthrobacter sp. SO3]MCB5291488.1 Glutaredoxin-like protein NrdH [Arthrobacter sp. SO3]